MMPGGGPRETARSDWHRDERFWSESYPFMFPEWSYRAAEDQAGQIAALTGCAAGALLDQGCGPGRYAVPFAQLGFSVTGVDQSSFLLAKAGEYAARRGVELELLEDDMRRFARPRAFDLAVNLYTSFGFFDRAADNLAVLERLRESLKPGGCVVVDLFGKEILARELQATSSSDMPDGRVIVQRRWVTHDWSRMEAEWVFIGAGEARSFRLRHWLYSGRELHDLLDSAGFADIRLYGDFTGAEYGPRASRLVAVARKKVDHSAKELSG